MNHVSQLIEDLCRQQNLYTEREKDGCFRFDFDQLPALFAQPIGRHQLLLHSRLQSLPDDHTKATKLLRRLLQLNLAGLRTRREVLALDDNRQALILHRLLRQPKTVTELQRSLEAFIDDLEFWCRNTDQIVETPTPPSMMLYP